MKEKHPNGLIIIFLTEMWERFSYYGMRALLVLYLVKKLLYTDDHAGKVYGAYTGLVYLTPVLGGYLADQFLGYRKSIYIGGLLMMGGHISLGLDSEPTFYLGLVLLILGNGFFKPNMTNLLGKLYDDRPALKDSGYTIYYVGINLGAFLGSILCGYVGEKFGWHYGFGIAAVGMGLGLINFTFGKNYFSGIDPEKKNKLEKTEESLTEIEKHRIYAIFILSLFTFFFWLGFEQAGSSINLFTDRYVNRIFFGHEIPASSFQALNPFLILFLAPLFAFFWDQLSIRGKEISTLSKFVLAFLFLGLGFLILAYGSYNIDPVNPIRVSFIWLFMGYLFHTVGELCISPIGLSMVSRLSPPKLGGVMMGLWFLSNAFSHYASGLLSGKMMQFPSITEFFLFFTFTSIVCGMILFSLKSKIERFM